MSEYKKKWIYCGEDHGLDFDAVPGDDVITIPESLKPSEKMMENFRRNCESLGLMEKVIEH